MESLSELSHLFVTVFLYNFSNFMVIPAIPDVTMSALCPGEDECSLAIYLTGIQQAIMGLGTLVIMPLIGKLSDSHGRKSVLTLPMILTIIPLAILAYSRTKNYFLAYYVLKTLTAMVCEGSVLCISLAYVADKIPENGRASVFGILSGINSSAFVCGNLSTRFLSPASTFQISALLSAIATIYMRVFLPDSIIADGVPTWRNAKEKANVSLLDEASDSTRKISTFKTMPSFGETVSLLKSSSIFLQAATVAFFLSLGDGGFYASLLYYLKACFHFNKDQFADLMVIVGVAGTISQIVLMPMMTRVMGEENFFLQDCFSAVHMRGVLIYYIWSLMQVFLYSIAWTSWVPYVAAMFTFLSVFASPCLRSIASKQVGPDEQGKAQGCISGLCSFANVVSPLIFSPLTALFLSADAPFRFPGFSIACSGFVLMIAFIQGIMIKAAPPVSNDKASNCNCCADP